MSENINVVPLRQPNEVDDPLTNILRSGARQLLAQAVEMEAEAFLLAMKGLKLPDGRDRLVRHGHGPERTIQTGIGPVEVERVKIRDRAAAENGERIRFTSAILPLWARRTKSLDTLLPVLYLRGISTGDFQEALAALLGQNAPNLSLPGKSESSAWQKPRHAASAVLGAQDRQRLEQSHPLGADQHEEGSARDLLGAEPGLRPKWRSTSSPRNTERNTTRRSSA